MYNPICYFKKFQMNKKTTSKNVASLAAQILKDASASATAKKLAGSVLSQSNKER